MSFGILKPKQGYWTRMMTAIAAGVVVLAGAMWTWQQLSAVRVDFELVYLQAAVAGGIALIGAIMIYWIVGVKPRTVDFFIATEGEMQKVNWSTRREVLGSTWVVIGVSLIIAAVLFITDIAFSNFFQFIDILER